jgi:hypothetical protein
MRPPLLVHHRVGRLHGKVQQPLLVVLQLVLDEISVHRNAYHHEEAVAEPVEEHSEHAAQRPEEVADNRRHDADADEVPGLRQVENGLSGVSEFRRPDVGVEEPNGVHGKVHDTAVEPRECHCQGVVKSPYPEEGTAEQAESGHHPDAPTRALMRRTVGVHHIGEISIREIRNTINRLKKC